MQDNEREQVNDEILSSSIDDILRIGVLALRFASEPETIAVFARWAHDAHNKIKACNDPKCAYNYTPEQWQPKLLAAGITFTKMLNG